MADFISILDCSYALAYFSSHLLPVFYHGDCVIFATGIPPPPMQAPPFIRPDIQAAPPVMRPDEPPIKKSKVDTGPEANLIPENVFLQRHQGSVRFQVQVPEIPDKTEWKCNGQKIFLTIPWTDPVRLI